MQARSLPFSRGYAWLKEGFALWRKNPALLTFVTFGYLLFLVLLSLVPVLGQIVASVLMPVLSLGILNACRAVDRGERVGPDILLSGFRQHLRGVLVIGGVYVVTSMVVLLLTMLADGGTLFHAMTGVAPISPEEAQAPGFSIALGIGLFLSTPVMMAYWFAPVLAGWQGLPAAKALFFSFFASLRNWKPFLGFALSLGFFGAIVPGVIVGIVTLASPMLGSLLSIPLPLILLPVIFASFYVNIRDVFPDLEPGRNG
ncbi:MAG: hypothetical protein JNJ44_09480 [Zoogloeaceae bacterium]|nr:hypothetical protein [Zoogloeaceae bacterium]